MKTLQNNFTTPEQSKRLLELGVPADSADCYRTNKYEKRHRQYAPETDKRFFDKHPHQIPCWSVGRLIEIYTICRECTWEYITNNPPIEDILCDFELHIDELDFSKLEE